MAENEMEGAARNVGGKVESAVGNLTGDTKTQADGKIDQVAGQAQQAYGNAKDAVSSAADQAQSKLGDVADKAQSKLSGVADQAQSKFSGVADQAQSKLSGVADQASQLGEQAYEQGAKAAKYVGDYVRDEPVAVMLGVAAIGMLVGYMLGRPPHERAVELGRFRAAYRDR